ncbi:MAG: Fimbrial assembly protein (PilN) [Syntrophorhabdaceae bacterium PtaU1.Bin034]|nr:MAG: Fimbrial assembly protein (PilN) [Syntrophorhabdaceae bacterium PtaU1.Bin034]
MSTGIVFRLLKKDERRVQGAEAIGKLSAKGVALAEKTGKQAKLLGNILTFSLFRGILAPQKSLCVSLEKGSVSVATGSRFFSKIRIKGMRSYAFQEVGVPGPEAFAGTVALAARELKASKLPVILSIPPDRVVMRTACFPVTVKETIDRTVGYELDRLTPFTSDDAYYDFKILTEKDSQLKIIVIAARAGWIDPYLGALSKEGIAVAKITVNVSGLGTLCSYMGFADSICVETEDSAISAAVVRGGMLTSSFGCPIAENGARSRESSIGQALKSVIEEAKADHGDLPPVVVSSIQEDRRHLQSVLGTSVVVLGDEDIRRRLSFSRKAIPYSVAGTIVESLWPRAKGFNLLRKGTDRKARRPVLISLILGILVLATWVPYVFVPLRLEEKKLMEMERQIAARKEEVKKVEALRKEVKELSSEIETINGFKADKPMMLVIMKELTAILPKSVWLTRVRMTEKTVDLEGYAVSASEVLPKLEQSKYLKKAEFASPTVRDSRTNTDKFVIRAELEGFTGEEGGTRKDEQKK